MRTNTRVQLLRKSGLENKIYMSFDEPPKSAETFIFISSNDALGTHGIIGMEITHGTHGINFRNWSHPVRLRPWVLHAPGVMMTVVNTNSLK